LSYVHDRWFEQAQRHQAVIGALPAIVNRAAESQVLAHTR
jgi:hypothetical protein